MPIDNGDNTDFGLRSPRTWLMFIISVLLAITIGIILWESIWLRGQCTGPQATCDIATKSVDSMMKVINPVFTALLGVFGSVVGFYFGEKKQS